MNFLLYLTLFQLCFIKNIISADPGPTPAPSGPTTTLSPDDEKPDPDDLLTVDEKKAICSIATAKKDTPVCKIKGDADDVCKELAKSINASVPKCVAENICAFKIPELQPEVETTTAKPTPAGQKQRRHVHMEMGTPPTPMPLGNMTTTPAGQITTTPSGMGPTTTTTSTTTTTPNPNATPTTPDPNATTTPAMPAAGDPSATTTTGTTTTAAPAPKRRRRGDPPILTTTASSLNATPNNSDLLPDPNIPIEDFMVYVSSKNFVNAEVVRHCESSYYIIVPGGKLITTTAKTTTTTAKK